MDAATLNALAEDCDPASAARDIAWSPPPCLGTWTPAGFEPGG
jgi:hypothetical protein